MEESDGRTRVLDDRQSAYPSHPHLMRRTSLLHQYLIGQEAGTRQANLSSIVQCNLTHGHRGSSESQSEVLKRKIWPGPFYMPHTPQVVKHLCRSKRRVVSHKYSSPHRATALLRFVLLFGIAWPHLNLPITFCFPNCLLRTWRALCMLRIEADGFVWHVLRGATRAGRRWLRILKGGLDDG